MFTTILAFLVALGVIITFHEYGHYWAARRCGVRVLRFSVGFGKPLLTRVDKRGTEWVIAGIPLGGYVKMLEEPDPSAFNQSDREAFSQQPVRNRFFIVAAGPIANFVLAAVLYAGLSFMGTQEPVAILAQPQVNTPAQLAGIERGDQLVAINGEPVQSWNQVRWQLLDTLIKGGEVSLTIERAGMRQTKELNFPATGDDPEADPLAQAGLTLKPGATRISNVQPGSAAQAANLQVGDVIVSVDGAPLENTNQLIQAVKSHPGKPLRLSVNRDGLDIVTAVTPDSVNLDDGQLVGRIGVGLSAPVPTVLIEHGVLQSAWQGLTRTFDTAWFSLKMLGNMLTGVVSWKNISGPVTIADYAGQTAQMGLSAYLAFLALISVSIGVLNLLPIPMLDGGHLMYYLAEIVRGKPVPMRWLDIGQRVGVVVLGSLMTLAIFNDLTRLLG